MSVQLDPQELGFRRTCCEADDAVSNRSRI